jgi:acid stress-induced BolA-like protein IbaG/YrbA
MADLHLKAKIHDILKQGYFSDSNDLVDVSDGPSDGIHVVVVSRKFDGRRMKEKNDLIWSELVKHLRDEEWGLITLSVGASPEELKAS